MSDHGDEERPAAEEPAEAPAAAQPSLVTRARNELREFFGGLDSSAIICFFTVPIVLLIYDYWGDAKFFRRALRPWLADRFQSLHLIGLRGEAAGYFYWYGAAFVLLMLIPIVVMAIDPKQTVRGHGLGLGNWRLGLPVTVVFTLIMVAVLTIPWPGVGQIYRMKMFDTYYPLFRLATRSWQLFVAYELAYALYFIAWEYLYRGYMVFTLERSMGKWAIFVQMLPFAILHFGKPSVEALSSIFGGVILGWLAWKTRSFWYGVVIHACMAVSLDLLVGIPRVLAHMP